MNMVVSEGTSNGTPCYFVDLAGGRYTVKFSKKTLSFLGADDVHTGEYVGYDRSELKEFMRWNPKIYVAAVEELQKHLAKKKRKTAPKRK